MALDRYDIPETEEGLNEFLDNIEAEGSDALTAKALEREKAIRLFNTGQAETVGRNDRAHFRANIIRPSARRKGALLTETKPQLDVRPTADGLTATAEALKRTIEAAWEDQGMQSALEDIGGLYLQVLNAALLEIGYDPNAAFGLGDIAISAIDPRQVIVDPAIVRTRDLNRAQYLRVNSMAPLHVAAALYPAVADDLVPSKKILATEGDNAPQTGGVGTIVRRATSLLRRDRKQEAPIPRVELATYWFTDPRTDADGNPLYPGGRCVVRANEKILCLKEPFSKETLRQETANPYYDGQWPYEMIDNMPDLDTPWGEDEILAARYIQNTFDRIGNTTVKTMLVNARPFIMSPKNSLDVDTVNTLQALDHIVLQYTAGRGEPNRQPSPIPSTAYFQLMQLCQSLIEYTGGLQDAGGGVPTKGRAEVRSASMLEGLQSAAQVLVRAQARRFEQFLERVGQKWISRIFQFMTLDRLLWAVGEQGAVKYAFERATLTKEILDIALKQVQHQHEMKREKARNESPDGVIPLVSPNPPEHLDAEEHLAAIKGAWRTVRFKVVPFSSLSATRIQRSQLLMQLNQQAMVPGRMVLEELGFDNPKDLLLEAVTEATQRAALGVPALSQQPKGKGQKSAQAK